MPLRDHFHPPLSQTEWWDGVHGLWPSMIVLDLFRRLPPSYTASPRIHLSAEFEIDVATYEKQQSPVPGTDNDSTDGTATAVWAPPEPTLTLAVDLENQDEYEVLIHSFSRRLVAAIEIVSPANKNRPEHRRTFAAKCATLMQKGVSVCIVDLVTARGGNLYLDMLDVIGESDPSFSGNSTSIYATSCRYRQDGEHWKLESWAHPLHVGRPLPTPPALAFRRSGGTARAGADIRRDLPGSAD